MGKHPCDVLKEAYVSKAIPASLAKFQHHWLEVTAEEARDKWLKLLRPGDCEEYSAPDAFLRQHGMSFVYPLSLYGYYIGFAIRAIETKDMRSFVRYPYSACYSSFASSTQELPWAGVTTILVEGYADVEATAQVHPWVIGAMSAHVRTPLIPLVASISNRVIVMLDGDQAGKIGYWITKKQIEGMGKKVSRLEIPPLKYEDEKTGEIKTVKDPADWLKYHPNSFRSMVRRAV